MGRAYAARGDLASAENCLLEAQSILDKTPGSDPADRRRNLEALVQLYQDPAVAAPDGEWQGQAAQWQAALDQAKR